MLLICFYLLAGFGTACLDAWLVKNRFSRNVDATIFFVCFLIWPLWWAIAIVGMLSSVLFGVEND